MILAAEPGKDPGATPGRNAPRNVAVFLFDGVELLDFAGPADVFSAAGSGYKVYTVAESTEPIVSQGFVKVVPEFSIDNCPKPDVLVVPGGNTAAPLASPRGHRLDQRSFREHRGHDVGLHRRLYPC